MLDAGRCSVIPSRRAGAFALVSRPHGAAPAPAAAAARGLPVSPLQVAASPAQGLPASPVPDAASPASLDGFEPLEMQIVVFVPPVSRLGRHFVVSSPPFFELGD